MDNSAKIANFAENILYDEKTILLRSRGVCPYCLHGKGD